MWSDDREEQRHGPQATGTLHQLGDIDQTVVDPDADVRGRTVVGRDGQEVAARM